MEVVTFQQVAICPYAIGQVAQTMRDGIIMQELSTYAPVINPKPGKALECNIGGKARTVIGKVAIQGETAPRPIMASAARIYTHRVTDQAREAQQAYLAARRVYDFKLNSDGTFRAEDVEPGQYTMHLRGVPDAVPDPRLAGRPAIRIYQASFTLPPPGPRSSQPPTRCRHTPAKHSGPGND